MAGLYDLVYALRDGKLVSIRQVGSGKQLDCLCPACGSPLIAKKGRKRQHHFAHVNSSSCESAAESALHRLAKQLICTPGTKLALPPYTIVVHRSRRSKSQPISETVPDVGGATIQVAEGREESRFDGFTADAVISVHSASRESRKDLIVEIAVTHPCGKAKIRRIAAVGVPAIEIDLCEFPPDEEMSAETVRKLFLESERMKWIFHPKQLEARRSLARKLRLQRIPFDVLRASAPAVTETHLQTRGGFNRHACGSGWDHFYEDYVARYGAPSLEDFRKLQDRFFGRSKKRKWP